MGRTTNRIAKEKISRVSTRWFKSVPLFLTLSALIFAKPASPALDIALTSSASSTVSAGDVVTWNASVSGESTDRFWYRFRARLLGSDFHVIRDYGPNSILDWTALDEGTYEIEVSVRDRETGDASAVLAQTLISWRVTDGPAVNPTANPLVFLYSAPPCSKGSRMRVQFQTEGGPVQQTPFKSCDASRSMNFYVAGLLPNTPYKAWYLTDTGSQFATGPSVGFATGDSGAPAALFTQSVVMSGPAAGGFLLASSFVAPAATDLKGNLVWYANNGVSFITSVDPSGGFWSIVESSTADQSGQSIRKFDLTGLTLKETNAARVNEQLSAMGRRPISAFHHDVKTLPDGRIVALAAVEQILSDVQGPGPVDILGDAIIVLDSDLNVIWSWDTFDHLDVTRAAVLGEICNQGAGGCPPYYLAAVANDWTHGNSVQQTPDGQFLYSARHQDWLVKIAYDNGEGDGHVIWKLGKDGDFRFDSADPYPWFSHQHDANVLFSDPSSVLVFDNGNTRHGVAQGGNSRGQVIRLDEQNRTATLALNADLGVYSLALGTAQQMSNGNFNFDAGYIMDPTSPAGSAAYAVEVDPAGKIVYKAKANAILYRWLRVPDLYSSN